MEENKKNNGMVKIALIVIALMLLIPFVSLLYSNPL